MKVVCSWCVADGRPGLVGEKAPLDDLRTTHTICAEHREVLMRDHELALKTQTPAEPDLTQKYVQVPRAAVVRAVRALDMIEGLALLRSAYNLSLQQARQARALLLAERGENL